jgi:trk system potassium uptake protein TrkA
MHIVILGAGSVGFQLAKQLIDENRDVAIIEKNAKVAKHAANYLDCLVIHDEGRNIKVLKEAGIEGADFFISVTDSDEVNMITCGLVASTYSSPSTIARVRNIDYSQIQTPRSPFMGIDYVVNPEVEASKVIIRAIEHGALGDILFFEKSRLQMRNMIISADSPLCNHNVQSIKSKLGVHFLIAFILRNNDFIIPSGDTKLLDNDNLYIISTEHMFEKLFSSAGKIRINFNKIVIIGGGKIGGYIAEHLLRRQRRYGSFFESFTRSFARKLKKNLVIIDKDSGICEALADRFSDALIINEDISDEGIYEEGQLSKYDLLIASTDNQELNLITAAYAKTIGIKRSIAVVNKYHYLNIASKIGVDVTVSQKNSIVNSILKLIRRGNIRNIYSFIDGRVEVIELLVAHSPISGSRIRDMKLPPKTLIVSIAREGDDILPDGNSTVLNGDHIIVIAEKESIPKLEAIFT